MYFFCHEGTLICLYGFEYDAISVFHKCICFPQTMYCFFSYSEQDIRCLHLSLNLLMQIFQDCYSFLRSSSLQLVRDILAQQPHQFFLINRTLRNTHALYFKTSPTGHSSRTSEGMRNFYRQNIWSAKLRCHIISSSKRLRVKLQPSFHKIAEKHCSQSKTLFRKVFRNCRDGYPNSSCLPLSSHVRTLSPHVRTLSPHVRTLSPHVRTLSPHVRTLSPHVRTLSPHVHANFTVGHYTRCFLTSLSFANVTASSSTSTAASISPACV